MASSLSGPSFRDRCFELNNRFNKFNDKINSTSPEKLNDKLIKNCNKRMNKLFDDYLKLDNEEYNTSDDDYLETVKDNYNETEENFYCKIIMKNWDRKGLDKKCSDEDLTDDTSLQKMPTKTPEFRSGRKKIKFGQFQEWCKIRVGGMPPYKLNHRIRIYVNQ